MCGENTPREDLQRQLNTIYEIFKRTFEDLHEAYYRTPAFISSKIYILRALNRVKAGINLCSEILAKFNIHERKEDSKHI